MPQKALATEKVEELRSLRSEGLSLREVAARAGVSEGAVSNYTRGIAKPARRPQGPKEAPLGRREGKDIMSAAAGAKIDEETADLANRVRKARLQAELDDVEDRKRQRLEIDDLRLRERKLLLQLDETRLGASKGDSAVVGELTELRRELGDLREARHQTELRQSEDRHSSEMRQVLAGIQHNGLSEYDIMSRVLDKGENLAIMVTDKVDKLLKGGQGDKQLVLGLQLGLTPLEFQLLQQGQDPIPTKDDWLVGRRYRAHRDGVKLEEPAEGEFEGLVALIQQRNRRWQEVMDRAQVAMGRGGSQVVTTGKRGAAPAPGEPEPVVLKAESKLVKCTRCGTSFDIDLVEARQAATAGKRLFVNCANPKCNFLLDLASLMPELKPAPGPTPVADKSTTPQCYELGSQGECVSRSRNQGRQCGDCAWSG